MAWLPPFRYPDDYSQVTAVEMAELLVLILRESGYETIVLDIGNYDRQVLPILDVCNVIYMPIKEDSISQAKLKEFEKYAGDFGSHGMKDKVHKIREILCKGI